MDAVGIERKGEIDPVVDDEGDAVSPAFPTDGPPLLDPFLSSPPLPPVLQHVDAAGDDGVDERGKRTTRATSVIR
jgi:hypothetical protein